MAQTSPWDAAPVVRSRQDEREKAETRYRNTTGDTNPLAQPVILPGEEGYAGPGEYLPTADVVVRGAWDNAPVLTESQTKAAQEAERRYGGDGGLNTAAQGTTFGFLDEGVGRLAQIEQMGVNLGRRLTGQPIEINSSDLNDAIVENISGGTKQFAQERPATALGLTILGGIPSGGAAIGQRTLGGALTGGAYGALSGLGNAEGGFVERAPSGVGGGIFGGVVGAGGSLLGSAGRQVVNGKETAAPYISRIAGITGAGMRRILPARQSVEQRFAPMIDDTAYAERARLQGLGVRPSVVDVLPQRAERLARTAAGPAGPGAEAAITRSRDLTQNLKPDVMSDTRALSPDPRTASQVRQGLLDTRDDLATTQYAEPYATQVSLTDDAVRSLRGPNGEKAIREAIEDELASPNYRAEVVDELTSLIGADLDRIPTVSGRALDRVRIALRDTSEGLMRGERPARTRARGIAERVSGVDTALDNAPGLVEARGTYRNLSGAAEAIDNAADAFTMPPDDFAQIIHGLTPDQRQAAIIGVRQEVMDTLGGQKAAGTGTLDRISQAPYARQNLSALLGEDEAARYLAQIDARVQQAQRAARISPNTNSQTFGRGIDEETFNAANMVGATVDAARATRGDPMAFGRTLDRLRARATMSPADREAIVSVANMDADELENIVRLAQTAQDAGRPVPREVRRFIDRTRNTLGQRDPVTQQLERLLLPAPASAQEEQQ